jgi:hypothetical protein
MTAIPYADAPRLAPLARRTRTARLALAAALLAAAALALLAALRQPADTVAFLPEGSSGIVVLDVSASISPDTYARIAATLERLADSRGRYGLVLFSDTAYLALPPGTPAAELRAFERFFRLPRQAEPGLLPTPPPSPWAEAFGAGTRISTGLALALDVVRRQQLERPAVLLVSDLDDSTEDLEELGAVVLEYRRAGLPLHAVGLNPAPEDERFVGRLLRDPGDLVPARLPGEAGASASAASPLAVVAAAVAVALLLAAFLVASERLRWRTA